MQRIGLTGGIAAGKSTASEQFAKLGAVLIDYDQLARDAVAPGSPVLTQIAEQFGPEFIDNKGSLDRAVMAARVFQHPSARVELENLIHPRVFELATEIEAKAVAENPGAIVIHDIPLLVEKGLAPQFDAVIVIDTKAELRQRRLINNRGLSMAEAQARIAAGATDVARREVADYLLDGNGSAANLQAQVTELFTQLLQSGPVPIRAGFASSATKSSPA